MDIAAPAASPAAVQGDEPARRAGDDPVLVLKTRILDKLNYQVGKSVEAASQRDWFVATALAVRNVAVDNWSESRRRNNSTQGKRVYYLSLEFLIGRLLMDAIGNLGLTETVRDALSQLRRRPRCHRATKNPMPRLAMAASAGSPPASWKAWPRSGISACGYGIRYEHGLFRQVIDRGGLQQELPEDWLSPRQPVGVRADRDQPTPIGFGGFGGRGTASLRASACASCGTPPKPSFARSPTTCR